MKEVYCLLIFLLGCGNIVYLQVTADYDTLYHAKNIRVVVCEQDLSPEEENAIPPYLPFELSISQEGMDKYYRHLSPVRQRQLFPLDTLYLNAEKSLKLLPADHQLHIWCTPNLMFSIDVQASDLANDLLVCVDELLPEKHNELSLTNRFLSGTDTLYMEFHQFHQHGSNSCHQ